MKAMSTIIDGTAVAATETRYGILSYLPDDDPIGLSLREYGEWAQREIDFVLAFLHPGATVVDVGANVGTHTLAFARAVGAGGRVHAFEPQATVFELLRSNVEANCIGHAVLSRRAAGAAAGTLFVPRMDYAAHINAGAVALRDHPDEACDPVDVVPIDALALDELRLIKIDVEGMESDVLRGAEATLARCRPFLYIECNTVSNGVEILRSLDGAGYALFYKRSAAFNPANLRANALNRFGVSCEGAVLAVPVEVEASVRPILDAAEQLFRIEGIDDLALHVLRTPRYGDRTEHERDAAWLANALALAGGPQNERVQLEAGVSFDPPASEIRRLEYRLAKQRYELDRSERRAAAAEAIVAAASEERGSLAELRDRLAKASRERDAQTRRADRLASALDEAASAAAAAEQQMQSRCNGLQDRLEAATRALDQAKARCGEHAEALAAAQNAANLADIVRGVQFASQARHNEQQDLVAALRADLAGAAHWIGEVLDRNRADELYVQNLKAQMLESDAAAQSSRQTASELQRRCEQLQATLAQTQAELQSLLASRSWRIMSPVRSIKRIIAQRSGDSADLGPDPLPSEGR